MPVINVTTTGTIATGPGTLTEISVPYSIPDQRFPRINSEILIKIADTDDHTVEYAPQLYVSDYGTIMLVGTRWPYYWEQVRAEPDVVQKLIVSTTAMPFTKGLSILSIPEGATITLDYNLHAPKQPLPPTTFRITGRVNPRRDVIEALDRRISERALKIAAKIPVAPEPSYTRVNAILERMRRRELKQAAKHTKNHFLRLPLEPSVDTPYPYPSGIVEAEPKPEPIREADYSRMAALMEASETKIHPALGRFDWLEQSMNSLIALPEPEPEEILPSATPPEPIIVVQIMRHATTTRNMGRVR
jgi:hypothetical protein